MRKLAAVLIVIAILSSVVFADNITLKDDQQFNAEVVSFDSYFLVVQLENKKTVNIPWREVRFVKHTTTASSWLEETYINNDEAEVDTMVTPLSEDNVFWNSVFPGFIIHGSGYFYAKNQNMGMSLMSAEIVSLVIMAVSINEVLTPVEQDQSKSVSNIVFFTGLSMFAVSWAWDMIFARGAAVEYNSTHQFLIDSAKPSAEVLPADAAALTVNAAKTDAVNNTDNAKAK